MTRRQLIVLGVGVVLILPLTWFLTQTDLVQNSIAPIIYAIYLIFSNLINSVPQMVYWLLFLLVVVQLIAISLIRYTTSLLDKAEALKTAPGEEPTGPVERYTRWLTQMREGDYFVWRMIGHVSNMALRVTGNQEYRSLPMLERALNDGSVQLPERVQQFMRRGLAARNASTANQLERKRARPDQAASSAESDDLIATLEYMEEELGLYWDDALLSRLPVQQFSNDRLGGDA